MRYLISFFCGARWNLLLHSLLPVSRHNLNWTSVKLMLSYLFRFYCNIYLLHTNIFDGRTGKSFNIKLVIWSFECLENKRVNFWNPPLFFEHVISRVEMIGNLHSKPWSRIKHHFWKESLKLRIKFIVIFQCRTDSAHLEQYCVWLEEAWSLNRRYQYLCGYQSLQNTCTNFSTQWGY